MNTRTRKSTIETGLFRPPGEYRDALFVEHIPPIVRRDFKAACYKRGSTMQAEILRFMKAYGASGGMRPRFK